MHFDLGYAMQLVRRHKGQILSIQQIDALKVKPDAATWACGGYWEGYNLVLLQGDLGGKTSIPFTLIPKIEGQPEPTPGQFELVGGGERVRLGEYEAAAADLFAVVMRR